MWVFTQNLVPDRLQLIASSKILESVPELVPMGTDSHSYFSGCPIRFLGKTDLVAHPYERHMWGPDLGQIGATRGPKRMLNHRLDWAFGLIEDS